MDAHKGVQARFPDGVELSVLHPAGSDIERSAGEEEQNEESVVAEVKFGKTSMLLTGDAGCEAEAKILARGANLRADVLKVGHHGSSSALTESFLRAVHPKIAVISVGRRNQFGHPSRETLVRLKRTHVRTYRTDLDGTLTMETDGETLRVRQSRIPYWLRARR